MDIDIIIKKLEIKYYSSLNTTLIKNNNEIEWVTTHINKLNKIESDNEVINKIDNVNLENQNDENLYKKSWSKLNPIHKIIKLKEFVNNLNFDIENNREELKELLSNLVKTKILTKKDKIDYDELNGKVLSIKNLQYKDNKYYYLND